MFAVSRTLRKLLVRHVSYSSENGVYSTRLWTAVVCHIILRYTTACLEVKRNTLCKCFVYPNTVPVEFLNSVSTDDSSLLSLWVSGYGSFEWLQLLYLPQSNCPWSRNLHERCETSGTANHPTAHRHIPEMCTIRKTAVRTEHCTNGGNICRYLAPMSSALSRTAHDIYIYILSYGTDKDQFTIEWFQATARCKWGHRCSVDR
jgi:hypothetical protein